MIYCASCGFGLQDEAAFCPECGTSVKQIQPSVYSTPGNSPNSPTLGGNAINFDQLESSAFFQFSKPLLDAIDHGKFFKKPFRWLYIVFAIACLLAPIYLLIIFIDNKVFDIGGIAAILAWLFIAFAGWVGFQIWWNRKAKINRYVEKGDDFLATPTFSHFIQTIGEWYGLTVAILGFGFSLCALIASNRVGGYNEYGYRNRGGYGYDDDFGLFGLGVGGFWGLLLSPLIGFFIVVLFRCVAEGIRAFAAIANNTRQQKK